MLETGEFYSRCADDTPGDFVLHGENVVDLGIVCFRPNKPSRLRLGKFDADANAIARTTDTARKRITRVQKASDLGGGGIRAFDGKLADLEMASRFGNGRVR